MHKSQEELRKELQNAAESVEVDSNYAHYKNPQQTYKVLHLATTEWDDSICVIYQAQYDKDLIFVRPLSSWLDKVEWQNKIVDRFSKVG
jgi:hypothetical protein